MPNSIQWQQAWVSRGDVLTTELNTLANDARTNAGAEVDNSANLDQFALIELNVTFASSPASGGYVQLYLLQAPDGSNYDDGSSSVDPGNHKRLLEIPVRATTSAQRLTSGLFLLPPAKVKFILLNKSGQAFPASGSTVRLYTSNNEVQ
ncbi:MAG: hypothetical protein GC164_02580 [Phycisphaera sp.]|nr:hypothetical protein [Phycisphaera sp.]